MASKFWKNLLKSKGVKRLLASVLAVVVEALKQVPGAGAFVAPLELGAGAIGGAGLLHASVGGTANKFVTAGLSSAASFLVLVCYCIPRLLPLVPGIQSAAAALGVVSLGLKVFKK